MRRILQLWCILAIAAACNPASYFDKKRSQDNPPVEEPEKPASTTFAKGADLGWITEMESHGLLFYNTSGKAMECTALFKELGFNAVRYRVWVNPTDGWCGREDVLTKCRRAKNLGMDIMIDFHYSDWWADPGKQNVPAAWKSLDPDGMAKAVADHTRDVLNYLKNNGIAVKWVQVGNEVENGMLWESGRVAGSKADIFTKYFNSGAAAVKEIYPSATVILHISNAGNLDTLTWFYDLVGTSGAKYDIIGLSLYPSYWQNGSYPDWKPTTSAAVSNFKVLHDRYSKPVMLVEFGMPASEPEKGRDALRYLLDGTKSWEWFQGIFFWEPESERSRNGYDYGAFADGKPTIALEPFKK